MSMRKFIGVCAGLDPVHVPDRCRRVAPKPAATSVRSRSACRTGPSEGCAQRQLNRDLRGPGQRCGQEGHLPCAPGLPCGRCPDVCVAAKNYRTGPFVRRSSGGPPGADRVWPETCRGLSLQRDWASPCPLRSGRQGWTRRADLCRRHRDVEAPRRRTGWGRLGIPRGAAAQGKQSSRSRRKIKLSAEN